MVRLNIHDEGVRQILTRLDFRFTPTFILFDRSGQESWRSIGSISTETIRMEIDNIDSYR